jgi:COP9 signalosome complex subunit 7
MTEKTTSNLLEQHIKAAKECGHDSKELASIIIKVIEAPLVYSFSELFELPVISKLQNDPNYSSYYRLLELFAYQTYQYYIGIKIKVLQIECILLYNYYFFSFVVNKNNYPQLSQVAITKLKQLTIVSLAKKCSKIPYKKLFEHLQIDNIRELEDLIIDSFYADIIKGKLDQLNNQLEVSFAIGRDVTDENIDEILDTLHKWCGNCDIALETIKSEIQQADSFKQKQMDLQIGIENEVK